MITNLMYLDALIFKSVKRFWRRFFSKVVPVINLHYMVQPEIHRLGICPKLTNVRENLGYFLSVLFGVLFFLQRKAENVKSLRTDRPKIQDFINLWSVTKWTVFQNAKFYILQNVYAIETGVHKYSHPDPSAYICRFATKQQKQIKKKTNTKQCKKWKEIRVFV